MTQNCYHCSSAQLCCHFCITVCWHASQCTCGQHWHMVGGTSSSWGSRDILNGWMFWCRLSSPRCCCFVIVLLLLFCRCCFVIVVVLLLFCCFVILLLLLSNTTRSWTEVHAGNHTVHAPVCTIVLVTMPQVQATYCCRYCILLQIFSTSVFMINSCTVLHVVKHINWNEQLCDRLSVLNTNKYPWQC